MITNPTAVVNTQTTAPSIAGLTSAAATLENVSTVAPSLLGVSLGITWRDFTITWEESNTIWGQSANNIPLTNL